ncbi:hypothetical protein J2S11_002726 [Bacillus horti]|uniref:Uncharacterized protein n=1 Tax=Caldalkalibacillus horti TaxID=77523 RepID=A0ABT9W0M5_9BACI|nr:hypothetical protein [Bacillus horti]
MMNMDLLAEVCTLHEKWDRRYKKGSTMSLFIYIIFAIVSLSITYTPYAIYST